VITLCGLGNLADQMRISSVVLLKVMVVPVHAMQAHPGSGGIAPVILNLDTRQM
jgi:hypothetical protein